MPQSKIKNNTIRFIGKNLVYFNPYSNKGFSGVAYFWFFVATKIKALKIIAYSYF
jgi:hypothetical protein